MALSALVPLWLGIAAAAAIYSVTETVLFQPLPWADSDRLVAVHAMKQQYRSNPAYAESWDRLPVTMVTWDALRQSSVLRDVAGWSTAPPVRLLDVDTGRLLAVHRVTSNLLPVLGVEPVLGRTFTPDEDERSNHSAMLSYEVWRSAFGGDPAVLGKRLSLALALAGDRVLTYEVVGILPRGFALGRAKTDLALSTGTGAATRRTFSTPVLRLIGRLVPSATIELARSEVTGIVRSHEVGERTDARVLMLDDDVRGRDGRPAWLLVAGVSLLVIVVWTHVAGLLIANARARRFEMRLRAALGGQPRHFVKQLLAEYGLLAAGGAVGGFLIALWFVPALIARAPEGLAGVEVARAGVSAAIVAGCVALAAIVSAGCLPMLSLSRVSALGVPDQVRRDRGSRQAATRLLVGLQTIATLVLIACATVLAEAFFLSAAAPLGFNEKDVWIASATSAGLTGAGSVTPVAQSPVSGASALTAPARARTHHILEHLSTVPGVSSAAAANVGPLLSRPVHVRIEIDRSDPSSSHTVRYYSVTESFFRTMEIPLVDGRTFGTEDGANGEAVIVSQEFARRYLGRQPVGSSFSWIVGPEGQEARFPRKVIGVVGDIKHLTPQEELVPAYYETFAGDLGNMQYFLLRADDSAVVTANDVRQRLGKASPGLMVTGLTQLEALVGRSLIEERFRASMSSLFAASSLLLAVAGAFALAARRASELRRDLGIRAALGASLGQLRRRVLRDAAGPVGVSLPIGAALAVAATSGVAAIVPGVRAASVTVVAGAAVLLGLLSVAAALAALRPRGFTDAARVIAGPDA
jgi:predicted permease